MILRGISSTLLTTESTCLEYFLANDDNVVGQEQGLVNILHGGLEDAGSFGAMVTRCNGFLSAVGCGLMIYIILKSRVRLSSTYHRIMFGISINGLITSIAYGCSYWLFPSEDELLSWPYFINENMNRFGGTLSCEIQGAIVISGTYIFQAYVTSLCLYYLCALVLRMTPETITKYVEWFLHLSPLLVGLIPGVFGLSTKSFNPGNTTPWCTFRRYPAACPTHCWAPDDEGCECIRGGPEYDDIYFNYIYTILLYLYSTIIFACLFAICVTTSVSNIKLRIHIHKSKQDSERYDRELEDILRFRENNHRSTLVQALLYVAVMVIIFLSIFLTKNLPVHSKSYEAVKGLHIFAITSQGLVFFVIFFVMKVHNIKVAHADVSPWAATKRVFQVPPDDVIIVNLEVLVQDNEKRRSFLKILEDRDGSNGDLCSMATPNGAICNAFHVKEGVSEDGMSSENKSNNSNDSNNLDGFSLASSFPMPLPKSRMDSFDDEEYAKI